ncbi:MAG: hypothetical protein ACE5GM_04610 [bacterium]
MANYFSIDFAHPGTALEPDKGKSALELLWKRLVSRELDNKLGALIIAMALLFSGVIFYLVAVYLPHSANVSKLEKEITKLKTSSKITQTMSLTQLTNQNKLVKAIVRIKKVKKNAFTWSDKLIELKRQLIKSLWLYSFKVKNLNITKEDTPKKVKGAKKQNAKKQKKKSFSDNYVISPNFMVTVKGTTFSSPKKQPVKLISKFIEGIMNTPTWSKYFQLKDWKIYSRSPRSEVVNFELSLVSQP